MSTPAPPCRLSVILARAAPVGVIFRRGPAKWVQIVHWDTATDTFTAGQWLHGRIYERRSDLSPSGRLLIYAARQEHGYRDEQYIGFWTAISKPPYLTALALWPCHSSYGGGMFLSGRKVRLNHWESSTKMQASHPPQDLKVDNDGGDVSEEVLLSRRREQEGWKCIREWQTEDMPGDGPITRTPRIDRKQNPHGPQALLLTTNLRDYKTREVYSVEDSTGARKPLTGAEWADWDHRGRLVYAQKGRLLAQEADAIGQKPPQELIDLNGNTFEAMEAPDWAKQW